MLSVSVVELGHESTHENENENVLLEQVRQAGRLLRKMHDEQRYGHWLHLKPSEYCPEGQDDRQLVPDSEKPVMQESHRSDQVHVEQGLRQFSHSIVLLFGWYGSVQKLTHLVPWR